MKPTAQAACTPWPRRRWLQAAGVLSLPAGLWGCATPRGSAGASTGAAPDAYRLVNRLSWGATDAEFERLQQQGAAAYIQAQLHPGAPALLPAPAQALIDGLQVQQQALAPLVLALEAQRKDGDALPAEDARKAAREAYQQALNRLAREAAHRHLLRALYSPQQLREQLTWFWFNHFNVHQYKHNLRALVGDYEERALRPLALGRFRDLLGAATRHPAMLRYLDNEQNAANRLNENHARELLELHTLGVDSGYSQADVQAVARVLSGHGVNLTEQTPRLRPEQQAAYRRDGLYEFNPARHDEGSKTVLGQTLKARGAAELDELLDLLAQHPATARFVSRKLARWLLADEPAPALVAAMAAAWSRSQGDIAEVLAVLVQAPAFTAAEPGKFKDPVHFVVSAVRACYGERQVLNTQPMQGWLNRLGQGLYNRQTPDGYPADAAAWSSPGQMAARFDVARALGGGPAGLFKSDDPAAPRELPAFPQPARALYYQQLRPRLAVATREALDGAASPQDWNTLFLSSPEFMSR